jgi:hydrogenase nickel incorporation protein HypB
MCLTCGCSDDEDVRLIDPVTGEIIPFESDHTGYRPHQHIDASGRVYTHTHSPSPVAAVHSNTQSEREQR